jgi:hypothetical protein
MAISGASDRDLEVLALGFEERRRDVGGVLLQ